VTQVAAVVLAAGGSTRMGRPKQLLPWRGRSLLRHAVDVACDAGCTPVVVVVGAAAEGLHAELVGLPVVVVENRNWEQGPGTSVRVGLSAIGPADAVVFLVCDQPFVGADHVRRLIDFHTATGQPMAASEYAHSIGVPALFAREYFPELAALAPDAGAKQVLTRHREQVAPVPFPAAECDIDTPADYERLTTE
jgi:molybdenum cofactor cytidylyltransferase